MNAEHAPFHEVTTTSVSLPSAKPAASPAVKGPARYRAGHRRRSSPVAAVRRRAAARDDTVNCAAIFTQRSRLKSALPVNMDPSLHGGPLTLPGTSSLGTVGLAEGRN